ncbi:MAG: hypothetical protein ABIZ81_14135 [Opitutaceae bacterium]
MNVRIKSIVALFAVSTFSLSAHAADAKENVASAIKALKEKGSYSWSTSTEMAGGQFPGTTSKGKTDKDGFALISREGQNGEIQTAMKGDKRVTKMDDGWKTPEEMQAAGGGGRGRGGFGGGFGGVQALPSDEAEALLKDIKEMKAGDGGLYTAELSEQGAKDRAGFGGRGRGGRAGGAGGFTPPEPKDAKGTVKFWVKDGVLIKYELTTSAKMTFQDQEMDIGRTNTTEISNVGSTKADVPEDAKKKLQ